MISATHCLVYFGSTVHSFHSIYQRSFHHAITNTEYFSHSTLSFLAMEEESWSIISMRFVQRTMMGAMFGYNTIICDTGSHLGIGEDAMSVFRKAQATQRLKLVVMAKSQRTHQEIVCVCDLPENSYGRPTRPKILSSV